MSEERVQAIERALTVALEPVHLEVVDDSHRHRGHAGARDGRGHFHVRIVSERFRELPRLRRHRLVYAALGDQLETDVHALGIEAYAPEEWSSD